MTWLDNLKLPTEMSSEEQAAVERFRHAVKDFADLEEGGRNAELNKLAYRGGILVAKGWAAQDWVEFTLEEASECNGLIPDDGIEAFQKTLHSGITSGMDVGPLGDNAIKSLVMSSEDLKHLPAVTWRIEGVLMPDSLAFVIGPPGIGKSFLCLDLVGSIAGRTRWQSRNINGNTKCLYIAAEGKSGLRDRVAAWEDHHSARMQNVDFVPYPVLYGSREWSDLAEYIKTSQPGVIVLDTMARCIGGQLEENSNSEMGKFVAVLDELRTLSNATIIVVHHTGKDGSMRGASSLHGAADTVLQMYSSNNEIGIYVNKQKEAEQQQLGSFHLRQHGPSAVFLEGGIEEAGLPWDK